MRGRLLISLWQVKPKLWPFDALKTWQASLRVPQRWQHMYWFKRVRIKLAPYSFVSSSIPFEIPPSYQNLNYQSELRITKTFTFKLCIFWGKGTVLFKTPTFDGFLPRSLKLYLFWKYSCTHHQVHGKIPAANGTSSYMSCKCYNSGSKSLTSYCYIVQSQFRLGVALLKLWSLQDMLHKSLMLNPGATGSECISFIMSDVMFTSRVIISLSIYPSLFPSNCLWPVHPK